MSASIQKVAGFDNVAKLLKTLIDDILAKSELDYSRIISIVSKQIPFDGLS
jgi:hypothetical protein